MNLQDKSIQKTIWVLAVIGIAYWVLFAFPNGMNAKDEHMLFLFSNDETITYPIVVHMLAPVARLTAWWGQLVIYGDYHYGYPFYFLSMLVILPMRILFGSQYVQHTQLNLFLLRQMISVLPMILAAGVLVYLQTRFRSPLRSALLFILILFIPGVFRNNLNWWHPDALSALAVALTLLFMVRDRLRLGRDFLLAALMCGLAVSIKMIGFFFVFTIAAYLAAAWIIQKQAFRTVVLKALFFLVIMALAAAVTNPFLIYPGQRDKMIRIQSQKQVELSQGYQHDDPVSYQKGPQWWAKTLTDWYGETWFLALLFISLLAGCLWGSQRFTNRLMLIWVVPYSIYLLWFVAVKPDHYWLPVMLPLFSALLNLWDIAVDSGWKAQTGNRRGKFISSLAAFLLVAAIGIQYSLNLPREIRIYNETLTREASFGY